MHEAPTVMYKMFVKLLISRKCYSYKWTCLWRTLHRSKPPISLRIGRMGHQFGWVVCGILLKVFCPAASHFTFYQIHWCSHTKLCWVWKKRGFTFRITNMTSSQRRGAAGSEPRSFDSIPVTPWQPRDIRDTNCMLEVRRLSATVQILSKSGQEGQMD